MHFLYMITCCLKSPSVVESRSLVQIEFRKNRAVGASAKDNMATSVHPDKFRGDSLEDEKDQEPSEEEKLKVNFQN